jgi:integrase
MTLVEDYLITVANRNTASAKVIAVYFRDYDRFNAGQTDKLVGQLKAKKVDVYKHLNAFVSFLLNKGTLSPRTIGFTIKAIKNFLTVCDVVIVDQKFRLNVKWAKAVKTEKQALERADVTKIISACEDIRLRTFVNFLASTGCRSTESLMLRLQDFDFTKTPIRVNIPGENTKTKQDRHTYLTGEMAGQLNTWLNFKYRERTIKSKDSKGNLVVRNIVPVRSAGDYVFLPYREDRPKKVNFVVQYALMRKRFVKLIARLGYSSDITLHKFRHYVYTTIDGLGLNQYGEWYIGHSGSPYWNKPEQERIATFKQIEEYLTYVDVSAIEKKNASNTAELQALQKKIRTLEDRDKQQTLLSSMLITVLAQSAKGVQFQKDQLQQLVKFNEQLQGKADLTSKQKASLEPDN